MNENLSKYFHKYTVIISIVVLFALLVLFGGEYLLFQRINSLNQMFSEGLMQVKEEQNKQTEMIKGVSTINNVPLESVKGKNK